MSDWPDDRIALLHRLAEQGLSAATIGVAMDATKNAIVGMCRRRSIKLQQSNNGGGGPRRPEPSPRAHKRKERPVIVVPVPVVVTPPVLRPRRAMACQWMEMDGPPWFACDEPVVLGTSWCLSHFVKVYPRRAVLS